MAKSSGDFDISSDLAAIRQDLTKLTERIAGIAQYQAESLGHSMSNGVDDAKAAHFHPCQRCPLLCCPCLQGGAGDH